MKKDATIYVAGHRGLAGSAIMQCLKEAGYTNIITRTHKELDLTRQDAVELFFNQHKPDYVFLCAAKVGGIHANNTYRGQFIYDNVMIQSNVIHAAYRAGVTKLLFLGSSCIYPKEASQPMAETALMTGSLEPTNSPYATAKIAGIEMCDSYNQQYGTNFIAAMPTNLYGLRDNFDLANSHVLPALFRKIYLATCLQQEDWQAITRDLSRCALAGCCDDDSHQVIKDTLAGCGVTYDEVEIWGTGKPLREFMWSHDMAQACIHLMQHVDATDIAYGCHVNVGTGQEIAIGELAQTIKLLLGFEGTLSFNRSKPDGTARKLLDVSQLRAFGFEHETSLQEGLAKLASWYPTQDGEAI